MPPGHPLPALPATLLAPSPGPDGRLRAERYTFPDEVPRVDVFDAAGRYEGTLEGFGIPLGFSGDLVLFSLRDDSTGGSQLGIFRITR